MFEKDLKIGGRQVVIRLSPDACKSNNDHFLFGFPLGPSCLDLGIRPVEQYISTLKGYFLYISVEDDRLTIANDITGGYRLYKYESENTIWFSDDPEHIIGIMKQHGRPELDLNEYQYWQKHGYTTGGATYIKNLRKLAPATIMELSSAGTSTNCYFPDIENTPDSKLHTQDCLRDLSKTITGINDLNKEVILFFSGGMDSTLLALYLKELGRDFHMVFIKSHPPYRDNYGNFIQATAFSDYIGVPLDVIEVDLEKAYQITESIALTMLFDRHISVLHFGAMQEIALQYGTDVVIVNGQGADNVLSYGPTTTGKGDFAARTLLNLPFGLLARMAGAMVQKVHGRKYRLPRNESEFLIAFLDQLQYYPVLSDDESCQYRKYLAQMTDSLKTKWHSRDALMMYMKIYTYLQGPDHRVVLDSAKAAGISRVIMPYHSPSFIFHTLRHKDKRLDLFHPKYVVKTGIKSFGVHLPRKQTVDYPVEMVTLESIVRRAEGVSMGHIRQLIGRDLETTGPEKT